MYVSDIRLFLYIVQVLLQRLWVYFFIPPKSLFILLFFKTDRRVIWFDSKCKLSSVVPPVSNTGFGSLSFDLVSHLPHIILTFPRVKGHPLRKPLERVRAQPSTLRKILRQIRKAWFMLLILARTHWAFLVWAVTDRILKTSLQYPSPAVLSHLLNAHYSWR